MSGQDRSTLLAFCPDVAGELGISESTARRWLASGRLGPTAKIGKRRAIRRADLEAWVDRQFSVNTDVLTE